MSDSTAPEHRFHEIEHKFVVGDDFDLGAFGARLGALDPTRTTSIRVRDTYYLLEPRRAGESDPGFVIRHRYDDELHHLTVKTRGADTEVRTEINLDLGHHAGDQRAQVEAFLGQLGVAWSGSLEKDLSVWYFPDAEVVHYRATTEQRSVACVEFEATRKPSLAEALETIARYERATGFEHATRSERPLVEILFPELRL